MLVISCTLWLFFFFCFSWKCLYFFIIVFYKYNVLKTLCDDVIIFSGPVSGVVWGFVVFVSLIFRWIIADYCGCTRIYTVSMRWSHLPVQQCQLNAFRYDLISVDLRGHTVTFKYCSSIQLVIYCIKMNS